MSKSHRVALVTAGHPYDVPALQRIFREMPGVEASFHHMDDWAAAGAGRAGYDVVVFYHMLMDGPLENGPWYQGNHKAALSELGRGPQGIVVLHHALLAYPAWRFWSDLVGLPDRSFAYHGGQQVRVTVANPQHPITRGLSDWDMVDETYTMADPSREPGNTVLLTTQHPKSMATLAWTRQFGQAKVFCFQSGHDATAFDAKAFGEVLTRGIRWCSPRTVAADVPATMPSIWFVERGKAAVLQDPTPICRPGQVLCRTLYSGLTNGTERNALVGGNYCGGFPGRCGYQNVGQVVEVGEGASGYAPGDLLFSGDFRQHQLYFAQNVSDPAALVVRLPPAVRPEHAALFGMASVAMHDVRRAGVRLGDDVLVIGAGPIGQFTAQAARAAGAVVTVVDLDERRLAVARECGAHRTVQLRAGEPWGDVLKGKFDVAFEDSGAPVLDEVVGASWGQGLIKHRGKLVLVAGRSRVDYSFNAGQDHELEVNHAGHFGPDDLRQLCRLVAEGVIRIGPVIQDVVPYEQAPSVYDKLRDAPASLFGTVFAWQ